MAQSMVEKTHLNELDILNATEQELELKARMATKIRMTVEPDTTHASLVAAQIADVAHAAIAAHERTLLLIRLR